MANMDIRHRQYPMESPIPIDGQQPQHNPDAIHPNAHPGLGLTPPIPVNAHPHQYYTNATIVNPHHHPDHPGCPNSLDCLPDTNEKPNHILPVIVRSAILGSPKQRLTIREIYKAIEHKFPYFRTTEVNWKDSIRHNLSLNKLFEKVPRPLTDPGIGSYWTVNVTAHGAKRPRKRKNRQAKEQAAVENAIAEQQQAQHQQQQQQQQQQQVQQHVHHPPEGPSGPIPPPPPHHFDPSLGFPHPHTHGHPHTVPGGHHFMQGPPQALHPGFTVEHKHDLDDGSLIDPSLDPSLAGPEDEKVIIVRLREELEEMKNQYALASDQASKLAEQLAVAEEEIQKCRVEMDMMNVKLQSEMLSRMELEEKYRENEQERALLAEKVKVLTETDEPSEVIGVTRNDQDVDADGDAEVDTDLMS